MLKDDVNVQFKWHGDKPKNMEWAWWMFWDESQNITHQSSVTFIQDAILSNQVYSSSKDNEHAILVKKGTITISNATVTKTW